MTTNCHQIDLALDIAKAHENSISELVDGWTKVDRVIYMNQPLTSALKDEIKKKTSTLRYRSFAGSSHYPADEGFVCDEHSIAISFPVKK